MDNRAITCEVLVVGGGPGGIAAACTAAEGGKKVVLVDNGPALGGSIWRGGAGGRAARRWRTRLCRLPVEVIHEATVFTGEPAGRAGEKHRLVIETPTGVVCMASDCAILATGARELLLPFPGWTLPNVMGVGGLQALVKQGFPIRGQRVVVAGSGPLLLAVAAGMRQAGAKVVLIAEQAPLGALAGLAARLPMLAPGKLVQGAGLQMQLLGVPYHAGRWVTAARPGDSGAVGSVSLSHGPRTREVACDVLACAYGLIPSVETTVLLGCAVREGKVQVNERQETSVPGIYAVGEACGIGGVDCALVEGQIAGHAALTAGASHGQDKIPTALVRARIAARRFAEALERTFALRPEIKQLASADTIVCRCEDVTRGQLEPYADWRAAKLHTRCGMGPCQGRICGGAVGVLRGWSPAANRPPVLPVRVESLAGAGGGKSNGGGQMQSAPS
jgi:D-hydroxyproline dehydrogenase subunit alpha